MEEVPLAYLENGFAYSATPFAIWLSGFTPTAATNRAPAPAAAPDRTESVGSRVGCENPAVPKLARFTTAAASETTLAAIRRLMVNAFGDDFSDEDWDHALGGWHVVIRAGGTLLAHAAVVSRRIEAAGRVYRTGYVEAVATRPASQRRGLATAVMTDIGLLVRQEFEMGALSTGRPDFYRRLGWETWLGPSYVRHGAHLRRSAVEDDGIMVLRFGTSADADLAAPIVCDARPGDDW